MSRQNYSVFGDWEDCDERFAEVFEAVSAQDAEEQMLRRARDEGAVFRIGTLAGVHPSVDVEYTFYVDPEDPRNTARFAERAEDEQPRDDAADLEELEAELGTAATQYTVLGRSLSLTDEPWNARTGGQRHIARFMASSPRIAEDLARDEVSREGGRLRVSAVFPGHKDRCESYPYSNHHIPAAA